MFSRNAIQMVVCAVVLSAAGLIEQAHAQGAPFTIRRPPDGATVREKVRVEIPRASIPPGGFVAVYVDGKFEVAVPPPQSSSARDFTWVWDTKDMGISDGEHTIRTVLYAPASNSVGTAVEEKGSSEVRLNVANKIHTGPRSLRLRYRFFDGQTLEYNRSSTSKIVGGVSSTGISSDQPLASILSTLLLDIESPAPSALVRNKLTSLSILQNGQEMTLDPSQLSASMYEELDPLGTIHYEYGSTAGLEEFMSQGLPVDNTLELPKLPSAPVSVGETWTTPAQRLDIPGIPPALQPKVRLRNTLVDLEWQDNYPTAKIHQSYDSSEGGNLPKTIDFGPVPVTEAQIKYDSDIYLAYTAGRLIKIERTLTVTGRTTVQLGNGQTPAAGGAGMFGGAGFGRPGMAGGMGGRMGMPGFAPGGMSGGPGVMGGPPPGSMYGGMGRGRFPGAGPGGFPGGPGGMVPGGMFGGQGGAMSGPPPGSMYGGQMGRGRFPGAGPGGFPGGPGGMVPGGIPGTGVPGTTQEADHPVTLKAITDTELSKVLGP